MLEWIKAKVSLRYLVEKVLGMKWLAHYDDWYPHVLSSPRSDHQAHRGSGKSLFWSFAVPLWDVIRGPEEGVDPEDLLVSFSEDQARRLLRDIRIAVETNNFLAPLRPSTKEIWGTDQLSFPNGYLLSGIGFGTSSRGKHPRRIIVDDPLKDTGGMSQEDQDRAYFGVIAGMAMDKTQIHCVGTPIEFGDLFEKIEANPAYLHTRHPVYKKDGAILCPELITPERLKLKRQEMGSINFAREMLLQRIDPATAPFKRQYETFYNEAPARFFRIVTVLDPAYSEDQGDFSAIVTVGHTHGGHAYVLEAKGIRREDPGYVVYELVKTIQRFNPEVVGIEKRKGDAIAYSFREMVTRYRLFNFKYVELQTRGVSKTNRINMVGGLVPRWEMRAVHIHPQMDLLRAQLYAYRFDNEQHEHDDLVDALAYCFHPDMLKPDMSHQNVPVDTETASIEGKPRYQIGQAGTWMPKSVLEWRYGKRELSFAGRAVDKRVGDAR